MSVRTVAADLNVPWEMRFLPDGSLLVTERGGRIVQVDVTTGTVAQVGTVDVLARGESGLMGLAVDPDYPQQPYIYVSYTYSGGEGAANRVSRFTLTGEGTGTPGLGEEVVLVDGIAAANIHNGSRVAFGPEGYLYVTTGDAGDAGLAQDLDSLNGKVLRMTREGEPAPGNPFADSLVYTYGHRNPQGLTFHPLSGRAYVTEHGPDAYDEINRLEPGQNYGWPAVGGAPGDARFVDALASWTPTIAPAGAVFYNSDALPGLGGDFLFVTLKASDLRRLTPAAPDDFTAVEREEVLLAGQLGRMRAIAVSPDGTIYLATSNRDGRGDPRERDDRIVRLDIR